MTEYSVSTASFLLTFYAGFIGLKKKQPTHHHHTSSEAAVKKLESVLFSGTPQKLAVEKQN